MEPDMSNYDRIARFYDTDMARNMAFDDAAFYAGLCTGGGSVLELGCGNGRILLELLARGIDIVGIDASLGMLAELRRKAQERAVLPHLCRMDARALAFRPVFDTVLCPYSLVTYLTTDVDLTRLLLGVRAVLRPGGALVIDTFVPRPVSPMSEFRQDYRRPFAGGALVRSKRITELSPGINRIERRYEYHDAAGTLQERVEVSEDIRPLGPRALDGALAAHGYVIDGRWWDYVEGEREDAQFYTARARSL
jgi:SAM-dependent methyltransferase